MDVKKLIDKDPRGTYCILFRNYKGLEKHEIEEIFSKFGTIYSIKTGGDKTGFHFIRYYTLAEAEQAVEGLKNHPIIKLGFHSPKNNKKNNVTSATTTTNNNEKVQKNNNNGHKISNKESKRQNEVDLMDTSSSASFNCKKSDYNEKSICNDFDNLSIYSRSSNNHSKSYKESNGCDIPELVNSKGQTFRKLRKPAIIIKIAEELVVANIHPDITEAYILHLFERFDPIAISKIKAVPDSNIRYCSVYLMTKEVAMKIEDKFDEYNLKGQKLLVLRPCRLKEEATENF